MAARLPADSTSHGLDNLSEGQAASALLTDAYWEAGREAATRATADADRVLTLMACNAADRSAAGVAAAVHGCSGAFIDAFGARAFRRPLSADERASLLAVYTTGRDLDGATGGIALLIQAVLNSPSFLFKIEVGTPVDGQPGLKQLTDHELASRLSFLFWGTLPDANLRATADRGELHTAAQVRAAADRLLQDERARDGLRAFFDAWLGLGGLDSLSRDPTVYPDFDPRTRTSMAEEVRRFVEHQVFDRDGTYADLLTDRTAFIDAPLAALYGVAPPAVAFDSVALPAGERSGLLTTPAVLALTAKAAQTSPVHRGKFVRERLMCDELPPPPPGVAIMPPDPDPNATTRERWSQHSSDPACSGCHSMMDPIGFTFEGFDAIGRIRAEEQGLPIDTSGEIRNAPGLEGPLADAVALSERLAHSRRGPECLSRQFFRYGMQRLDQTTREVSDACSVQQLQGALGQGGTLRGMLLALANTPAFLMKREMP